MKHVLFSKVYWDYEVLYCSKQKINLDFALFFYFLFFITFLESGFWLRVAAQYIQSERGSGKIWPQPNSLDVFTKFSQVLIACLWQHLHL